MLRDHFGRRLAMDWGENSFLDYTYLIIIWYWDEILYPFV